MSVKFDSFALLAMVDGVKPEDMPCTCVNGDPASGECIPCGVRDCPEGEPLHWHHDGCPECNGNGD